MSTHLDGQLLMDLADRLAHRYYGKYRGTVVDTDPGTMRIKASVPAVLGEVASGWCLPCVPYAGPQMGLFMLPEIGASVWVEFEGGDVSYPIWAGCFWLASQVPSDASDHVRGIVTSAGNKMLFDDQAPSVTTEDPNGNSLTLDSSGTTVANGSQNLVVSSSSVSVDSGAWQVTG
ncbi:MAG TPA: phage baseplate assembly protein V [Acidimicrobiales bacterium]|nr:phage baseplate assembly protein V [Acidimicrobiales bacterium]